MKLIKSKTTQMVYFEKSEYPGRRTKRSINVIKNYLIERFKANVRENRR